MARRYRPTLRPTTRASTAMVFAAFGAVLLLSVGWPRLGSLGDVMFLGTLLRGILIGVLLSWVADRTGFAHSRAAAGIAMVATALAIAGAHYQLHLEERGDRIANAHELREQSEGYGRDLAELDQEFEETVATLTFSNYLCDYFGLGNAASDDARDAATSKAGPALGIGLYSLEILIALLAAAFYPAGRASEPACVQCGRWYTEADPKRAAHGVGSEFISTLESGDADAALAMLEPPDTAEWVGLSIASCPAHCDHAHAVLRVRVHSRPKSTIELVTRHLADLSVSDDECHQIEEWA